MELRLSNYYRKVFDKNKVEIEYDGYNTLCKCKTCGKVWILLLLEGSKYKKGFWKCPNDCHKGKYEISSQ